MDLWLAYICGQQGEDVVGDIHASGTHNPGPDWSHYGVLRACFITGLGSGDSLEICCLALCRSDSESTQKRPVFHRLCSAALWMLKWQMLKHGDVQDCQLHHCLRAEAETPGLPRLWTSKSCVS